MKKKIVLFNILVTAIALALMFVLGIFVYRNVNHEQARGNIILLAEAYANNYTDSQQATSEVSDGVRVTVVSHSGAVLADSKLTDIGALGNHLDREEIQAALKNEPKTAVRYSDSTGEKTMYYALKVETGDEYVFLRVAIPVKSVDDYVVRSIPLMLAIMFGAFACTVIASLLLSDAMLKPLKTVRLGLKSLNEGSFEPIKPVSSDGETNKMLADINDISKKLNCTISSANEDKSRLDYVLNNILEGIVAFDFNMTIKLINKNAVAIFGASDAVGKNMSCLTDNTSFILNMTECIKNGKDMIFDYTTVTAHYLCTARMTEQNIALLVLYDDTAKKISEKARSDFFANASHELKTPLTSVKGFNELILMQNKDAKITPLAEQIEKEANRMLELINDMLKLSDLENKTALEKVNVDVYEAAAEVADSLSVLCLQKKAQIKISGNGKIFAEKRHIFELIKNLAENSIKYGYEGVLVNILIDSDAMNTIVTVSDNGIGIAEKHQTRIFERFYRIEKSRSRETGGTGLGLAIVKHIAELYKAELTLKSKPNEGTTVSVAFKNK